MEDGSTALLPVLVLVKRTFGSWWVGCCRPGGPKTCCSAHGELLRQLGRVPRRLIWDNQAGIGRGNRLAAGVPAFVGTVATRIVQLRPYDPQSNGHR